MCGSTGVLFGILLVIGFTVLGGWLVVTNQIENPLRHVLEVSRVEHSVEKWNETESARCLWQPRPPPPTDFSFFYPSPRCGIWMHLQHWMPVDPLPERLDDASERGPFWSAMALLFHSEHEHGGHFKELIHTLHQHYILPVTLDFVGHGYTWGDRMHLVDYQDLIRDADAFLTLIRKPHRHLHGPDVPHKPPIFLVGTSMGGLVARLLAETLPKDTFGGVILASP